VNEVSRMGVVVPSDMAKTLRDYVDVALPIGKQTITIWLVFPEDLEEAAEMLEEAKL